MNTCGRRPAVKLPRRRFLKLVVVTAILPVLFAILIAPTGHGARSQATRTIKMVVPVAPGGPFDILARLLADQIGRTQGVTMLIENRPGAGTAIATEAVSRAVPDGNTLLFMANSFVINPNLKKLNYDPLISFEPICYLARSPHLIIVNHASPHYALADLTNAARSKPGELTMAGNGPATGQHFGFEMLKRAANINMTFVPYPGSAPAVNALLGAHVTAAVADYAAVAEQMKAGSLRALAAGTRMRIETLPAVPTVAESYEEFVSEGWLGIVAPAKTPPETASQLVAWFSAALQVPEVKERLIIQGLFPVGTCGADFGALIRVVHDRYGRIIRESFIKVE
jgi:tripartite-type tricarboxylate transporter receptor subunit TctC